MEEQPKIEQQIPKKFQTEDPFGGVKEYFIKLCDALDDLEGDLEARHACLQEAFVSEEIVFLFEEAGKVSFWKNLSGKIQIGKLDEDRRAYEKLHKLFVQAGFSRRSEQQDLKEQTPDTVKNWVNFVRTQILPILNTCKEGEVPHFPTNIEPAPSPSLKTLKAEA